MKLLDRVYAWLIPIENECRRIFRGLKAKPKNKREFLIAYSGIDMRMASLGGAKISDERLYEIAVGNRYDVIGRTRDKIADWLSPYWEKLEIKYSFRVHRTYPRLAPEKTDWEVVKNIYENNDTLSAKEKSALHAAYVTMMADETLSKIKDSEAKQRKLDRRVKEIVDNSHNEKTETREERDARIRDYQKKRIESRKEWYLTYGGLHTGDSVYTGKFYSLLPKRPEATIFDTPSFALWGYKRLFNMYPVDRIRDQRIEPDPKARTREMNEPVK